MNEVVLHEWLACREGSEPGCLRCDLVFAVTADRVADPENHLSAAFRVHTEDPVGPVAQKTNPSHPEVPAGKGPFRQLP